MDLVLKYKMFYTSYDIRVHVQLQKRISTVLFKIRPYEEMGQKFDNVGQLHMCESNSSSNVFHFKFAFNSTSEPRFQSFPFRFFNL